MSGGAGFSPWVAVTELWEMAYEQFGSNWRPCYYSSNVEVSLPNGTPMELNRQWLQKSCLGGRTVVQSSDLLSFLDSTKPLSDTFECLKALGEGKQGKVGLWRYRSDGKLYAIKEYHQTKWHRSDAEQEFRIGLALDHPNIVTVHHLVTKGEGTDYLIMEFVDGSIVAEWQRTSLRSFDEANRLTPQVMSAFAHMGRQNIWPGDIDTGNAMISRDGEWKFIDLGRYYPSLEPREADPQNVPLGHLEDLEVEGIAVNE